MQWYSGIRLVVNWNLAWLTGCCEGVLLSLSRCMPE